MKNEIEGITARMAVHHLVLRLLLQANPGVESKLRQNRELFESGMLYLATSDGWHDRFEEAWEQMFPAPIPVPEADSGDLCD